MCHKFTFTISTLLLQMFIAYKYFGKSAWPSACSVGKDVLKVTSVVPQEMIPPFTIECNVRVLCTPVT